MKKTLLLCLLLYLTSSVLLSQTRVRGTVVEQTEGQAFTPIAGANVYWLGTTSGTTTDAEGTFSLPPDLGTNRLVVRCVGYTADTLTVIDQHTIRVVLTAEARQVADVEVVGERPGTVIDYLDPRSTQVMTQKEIFKAACCNLSESFQTNPSIDVSFTDAITGTRQIEMLGLAGTYSQITAENIPAIRGLTSNAGLTYIPGTWIESIQVSKGAGSVANGYESITGQINVELRKPDNEEEKSLFMNVFGNQDQRFEGNLHLRQRLGDAVSSMTLLHMGTQRRPIDENGDRFLDMPLYQTVNLLQRFAFSLAEGLENQVSVQYVSDEKDGGTAAGVTMDQETLVQNPKEYSFTLQSRQFRIAGKTGYVISSEERRSIGLQWAFSNYRQNALFGFRDYDGREKTGYVNLLYDSELGSHEHRLRLGLSFLFDQFEESFLGDRYQRVERAPGAFAEYTFSSDEVFSFIAGLRFDNHNMFGSFFTPRVHVRYAPDEDWIIRAVVGRGQRTANVFAENIAYLASARELVLPSSSTAYAFNAEVAWNLGFNITHYFLWDYREATIGVDVYRTAFDHQVVVNLDRSPQEVLLQDLDGASYSNSIQVEMNIQPFERLETRWAYRYLDVRQTVDGALRERPFVARNRAFVNVAYSTERENPDEPQMLYDCTLQWFGSKRLPDTYQNPAEFQVVEHSPSFFLLNAQVTRSFFAGLDVYLGVENLLDFRQENPILDPSNPDSPYFDSSYLWGPVSGRMVYAGLRWKI